MPGAGSSVLPDCGTAAVQEDFQRLLELAAQSAAAGAGGLAAGSSSALARGAGGIRRPTASVNRLVASTTALVEFTASVTVRAMNSQTIARNRDAVCYC